MNVVKKILTVVFILLLMLSILLVTSICLASKTILNKDYVLGALENSHYYDQVYDEMKDSLESYIGPSGLDESVLDNLYTKDHVKKDINLVVDNLYEGKKIDINTNELKDQLKINIQSFLVANNVTKQDTKAIDEFVNKIANEYAQNISHSTYLSKVENKIVTVKNVVQKMKPIAIGIAVVVLVILLLIHIHTFSEGVRASGIGLLASGLCMIVAQWILKAKVNIDQILILNEAFSNVFKNTLYDILANLQTIAIGSIIVGMVVILLANCVHIMKQEKN